MTANVLFRPEAIEAASAQRLGVVLIHQPWGYRVAGGLAGVLIILILAFGYFGTYTRKATVSGLLMPEQGMFRLTASSAGLLANVKVVEGQQVKAGEVLFVVSGERLSNAGGAQKLISKQLRERLQLLERNRAVANDRLAEQGRMAEDRLAVIAQELRQFQEEIRLLARRRELAHAQMQRQQTLVKAGFISIAQLQQAEAEHLMIEGQQQSTQRARNSLDRERTVLQAQRQDIVLRHLAEISDVDKSIALVRQEQAENDAREEQIFVAPFDGTVTGLNVQAGQHVASGSLLASLIPVGTVLTAHLYVESRRAGFIEVGQAVLMRYSAYPYQKFGMGRGKVIGLTKSPYAASELPLHVVSAVGIGGGVTTLYYRVVVELDSQSVDVYGRHQPLQVGMLLEGDVKQDTRRLYEFALEPIYSVIGKRRG
ncbi:HlyD family efflux transporter periplasmic adaptor subunit [Pseudomonas tructae]|uniref:HlyD family efflux transporter periplasmic adaptor subunit n=1 Tax=Pseudomonas tructae TaxID=2518644 RepID=A0A411MDM0_9PSED|nr:HlyD family efflux transporter periplasmic adaptor subunit [Pseudomonas tructae]QBF24907.1 HlyD family efflux transporter periplasmic adaptor subunit [Pseudomonas tructae]